MPGINGPELCRTVRNDPRWSRLAVIFATARTDPATIEEVFSAGADDYIPKPILGPELVTRVANRLERIRLYRA
jgi:DNA-binding response OmpR family regulator